jgi:predicted metal-dependent hydrolase
VEALLNIFQKSSPSRLQKLERAGEEFYSYRGLEFYWKKRAYYRHINIKMPEDLSCIITTGKKANEAWVLAFIDTNWDWIQQTLEQHRQNIAKLRESKILPKPHFGGWVPLLGHVFKLTKVESKKLQTIDYTNKSINLFAQDSNIIESLHKLYKAEAQKYLTKRQAEISKEMDLFPTKLSFRNQKTRWGSCSSKGEISYNWKLIAAPGAWVDYVVIHETAHLRHLDHSKDFWSLVSRHCENYKAYSKSLKNQQLVFDFLNPKSNLFKVRQNLTN